MPRRQSLRNFSPICSNFSANARWMGLLDYTTRTLHCVRQYGRYAYVEVNVRYTRRVFFHNADEVFTVKFRKTPPVLTGFFLCLSTALFMTETAWWTWSRNRRRRFGTRSSRRSYVIISSCLTDVFHSSFEYFRSDNNNGDKMYANRNLHTFSSSIRNSFYNDFARIA